MMIAPTTLTAYQLILTETELRAAIADPALMLPHYQAALAINRPAWSRVSVPEPHNGAGMRPRGSGSSNPDLRGQEPDPTGQAKPESKLRTAAIRVHSNDWIGFCTEFARLYPHYQDQDGQPDKFHISLTARRCGYPEVTKENFEQVVTALITHAQQRHPAPA